MAYLKSLAASLPLLALIEFYCHSVEGAPPGWSALKAEMLVVLFLGPAALHVLVMGGESQAGWRRSIDVCVSMWLFMCLGIALIAFVHHPGLAKDVDRTVLGFLQTIGWYFLLGGLLLAFFNAGVWSLVRRLDYRTSD